MSTFSSPSPQDARDVFDTGPLSWVMGEIREALNRSRDALREAAAQDANVQTTALRHAKSYLHQAHGALQIVDVDGVAIITETVEDLLDRADAGQLAMNPDLAGVIGNAYQALVEYLDELLTGMPHQPVRLFPYYRTLLEARGAERIHPADLFFPNLAVRPSLPAINPSAEAKPAHYAGLRQRYEKALLPFLKSSDRNAELANAAVMRDVVGEIENLQGNPQARAFWWVMHGLAEAVAADQISNEIYVKQLFARINLQIRRLCQGSPSIAERLLRDALFFIARIKEPSARGRQIRQTYQLDGLVPADYEKKRYGQVDADTLAAAKERLSQAKALWNRIVGGDAGMADSFEHEMRMLADAGSRLNSGPLLKLLRELKGIARHAAHAKPGERLGLEMAAGLLFVENSLNQIGHLPDNFAERADAMTARLLSVVAGDQPLQDASWLDDMSRQALEQQTMSALAGEMQGSLRQVEKILDEFFRDPAQHDGLGQLDQILHQIEGALSVLDQEDAMQAVRHTRDAVGRFHSARETGGASADVAEFQQVAQNVGALSFFIETLQHQSNTAKKRFSFDREKGLLRANLIEQGGRQNAVPEAGAGSDSDVHADTDADDPAGAEQEGLRLPTVEDELAFHQQKSAEIAMSLSAEPDNQTLQAQLKESLEKIRMDATLVDNPEANDRAQAGIDALKRPDFAESTEALAEIITATVPLVPAEEALPPVVAPATEEAIDAELLEIFLLEAEEVLGAVRQTMPDARNQPHNQEHLTTLRRSFHTLKGSGRMVGLTAFGEAAWSIEQVLNLRLAESRGGDPELFALLDKAAEVLDGWVRDLKSHGRSACTPDAIVAAAERIKAGGQFHYEETRVETAASVPPPGAPELAVDAAPSPGDRDFAQADADVAADAAAEAEPASFADDIADAGSTASLPETPRDQDADLPSLEFDMGTFAAESAAAFPSGQSAGSMEPAAMEASEPLELQLSDAELQAQFGSIGSAAADELTANDLTTEDLAEQTTAGEVLTEAADTDADAAADAPAGETSQAPAPAAGAEVIAFPTVHPPEPRNNDNVKRIGDLEISVPLHNIYLAETDELVRLLAHDIAEWSHEPDRAVSVQSVHAAHSLAGSSATVGFATLHELAHALEMVLQFLLRKPLRLQPHEFDVLAESIERMKLMLQKFALGDMPDNKPEYVRLLQNLRQDLDLRSEMAELTASGASAMQLASFEPLESLESSESSESSESLEPMEQDVSGLEALSGGQQGAALQGQSDQDMTAHHDGDHGELPDTMAAGTPLPAASDDAGAEVTDASGAVSASEEEVGEISGFAQHLRDELDADLMPVFLEEGRDMFPQMGTALRGWQERPGDIASPQAVLRLLHTLKGSARMAGAMNLGQHLHDMETRIENIMHLGTPEMLAVEDLLVRYDQALQMFEQLQNPGANAAHAKASEASEASEASVDAAGAATSLPAPAVGAQSGAAQALPAAVVQAPPAPLVPLVRVRADILDRLVNQAGEVSISRSRLENEVGSLQQSLSELTENVARLRDQLREIEMQAETQITSRMAHSADREFDPLEFDRFTRLQELTRMMAESVNDVGSVQQNLTRTLDSAVADLSAQARLTRDLQQDLMRARMVQFASISERLFRVTRQTAKETDKRVNLDIRGGAVEMDRGVLEKMTGPFEHLLRNAIVHGVETREARRAAGKPETGELLVEVRQEGNEVVIQFSDDGQGLDLGRIRDKAATLGLLADGTRLSDEEAGDLIFHPGFSTAEEVTELAGRGVGMDVVRSEAASLGGRVSTWTQPGRGTQFAIRLPLTLAVTQVVLLSTGGMTYAVPSVLVEQVQQLKANALAAAYNDGAVLWQGQQVPLHYLSALLGNTRALPVSRQYSSLLILKSGNDRVAVHVDEVLGNREVVVKNIGPQLSRMIGIAGATVLGSGEIVLILNPVPLAQKLALDGQRASRPVHADVSEVSDVSVAMGAVAEMHAGQPSSPDGGPVQGLRRQPVVMVVDDSLTVRRVTQRLLSRENYQVVLAKDGVDALQHLQSVTPDVMLVDIEMPRMDGFDLTRNVRGDERTRHIPIIMITSRTAEKHRNYAFELGVNEYLGKPYQEERLLGLIGGFVSKDAAVD